MINKNGIISGMKELIATFKEAYQKERSLVIFQAILLILSLAFLIFSALNLQPNASIVKLATEISGVIKVGNGLRWRILEVITMDPGRQC